MFRKIEKNSHENACARAFFLIKSQAPPNFVKKETLAQVFSCFNRTPLDECFTKGNFHCFPFLRSQL